ncbi:jmjC domain-containing protein 8 isoform X2 [Dendrobates tinctorius]|uniref:jmjC domain-containing protein 8 isoform X2 n=1 Tax=Dendrobates tinctorius TaxID=92724 RepID=UPI003CCA36DA
MADTFLKKPTICSLCKATYPEGAAGHHCGHDQGDTVDASRDELPRAEDTRSIEIDSLMRSVTILKEEMKTLREKNEIMKDDIKDLCRIFLNSLLESMMFVEENINQQNSLLESMMFVEENINQQNSLLESMMFVEENINQQNSLLESMMFVEENINQQKVQLFTEMKVKILNLKEREIFLSPEIKLLEDLCSQGDPVAIMQNLKSYKEQEKTELQAIHQH